MLRQIKGRFHPITDLQIELYLCDDLPPEEVATIETAMESSSRLRDYISERKADKEAFYFRHPRLEAVPSRFGSQKRRRLPRSALAWAGAAAAAILALVLLPFDVIDKTDRATTGDTSDVSAQNGHSAIRARGSLKVMLVLKRGQEVRRYRTGEPLYSGDQIRLTLESHKSGYLTVIAKDDNNETHVYYDAIPTTAGSFTVPDSLLLDDYVGDEIWLVLLSDQRRSAKEYTTKWLNGEQLQAESTLISIKKKKQP